MLWLEAVIYLVLSVFWSPQAGVWISTPGLWYRDKISSWISSKKHSHNVFLYQGIEGGVSL